MSQIYKARSGIFLHRHKNIMKNDETSTEQHKGGSLSTDVSTKMASQINNGSTGISGLGTQTILSKSEIKPSSTSVIYGGNNLSSQLGKLNFKTDKQKNIKLRL